MFRRAKIRRESPWLPLGSHSAKVTTTKDYATNTSQEVRGQAWEVQMLRSQFFIFLLLLFFFCSHTLSHCALDVYASLKQKKKKNIRTVGH